MLAPHLERHRTAGVDRCHQPFRQHAQGLTTTSRKILVKGLREQCQSLKSPCFASGRPTRPLSSLHLPKPCVSKMPGIFANSHIFLRQPPTARHTGPSVLTTPRSCCSRLDGSLSPRIGIGTLSTWDVCDKVFSLASNILNSTWLSPSRAETMTLIESNCRDTNATVNPRKPRSNVSAQDSQRGECPRDGCAGRAYHSQGYSAAPR